MINLDEPLTTDQLFSRTKQRQSLLFKRQGLVLLCGLIFGILFLTRVTDSTEIIVLDLWSSRAQPADKTDLVLLPISGKSIEQIGKWPWPHFRHAVILELLHRFGARSVYIDHTFSESESEEDQKALTTILDRHKLPTYFAAEFKPHFETAGPGLAVLTESEAGARLEWERPAPEIAKVALFGHRQIKLEKDRVFRYWQPWFEGHGLAYPIAALKMLASVEGELKEPGFLKRKETQSHLIPWNQARFKKWPRIEFSDLMQSYLAMREGMRPTIDPEIFRGRDVFIGLADEATTLSGLTPWHETVFPYEAMAAIYDGIRHPYGKIEKVAPRWMGFLLLSVAVALLTLWAGFGMARLFWAGWFGLSFAVGLAWLIFYFSSFWLPCVSALLFCLVAGAATFVFDAIYARQQSSALFHLATRDGLTNLYVIRHFRVIMNQMTREACTRKENIAVILMDIDHFKKINDTHGHPAGDMVLKKTAAAVQSAVRQKRGFKDVDFVARYGGEEFIVLVRRNTLDVVSSRVAERIRKAIEGTHFEWEGTKISVTASFGVAILNPGENIPDAMVHRADKALYLAKKSGRNRVCTEEQLQSE